MPNRENNQFEDVERFIAEIAEKSGKQRSPGVLSIVLLAGISSGIFSVGTKYVDPIDPRPDPYTGTQADAAEKERHNADDYLQRQINRVREEQKEYRTDSKETHAGLQADIEWLKQRMWETIGISKNSGER